MLILVSCIYIFADDNFFLFDSKGVVHLLHFFPADLVVLYILYWNSYRLTVILIGTLIYIQNHVSLYIKSLELINP